MSVRTGFLSAILATSLPLWLGAPGAIAQSPPANNRATDQEPERKRPDVFFPMAEQPAMEMHHHGQIPVVMPQFPHLGDSQRVVTGPVYELSDLEEKAKTNNPTLVEAQRAIEAARARKLQAGLYPNPVVGYRGDEIRGGSYGGGEQGFFVEQQVILGGKLGLNRKVEVADEKVREAEAEAQRQKVENDVRMAYFRVLAAQERVALRQDVLAIAKNTVQLFRQLGNVGQADETEILEAESEEQRVEVDTGIAEHLLRREWSILVSVIGMPTLPRGAVAGRIDADLPPLDQDQLLSSLLAESPTIRVARAEAERAEAALRRAKREPIPDLVLRGGLQQNNELLNIGSRQVGLQGFAEIGVQLHLWDRNQGGIAAEDAGLLIAREELRRLDLMLRSRFATYGEEYGSARLTADKYRSEILPRLERAYKLMTEQYGLMNASFLRVLLLQRMLYENETAYVDALERTWTTSIALRGFLLEGALSAPNSSDMGAARGDTERDKLLGPDMRMLREPSGLSPN